MLTSFLIQYEKVARAYWTSTYNDATTFCAKSCNTWVRQYKKNFSSKTTKWWEDILEYYIIEDASEAEKVGEMSILDEARGALPMSSP
jgi:hypothetical protein